MSRKLAAMVLATAIGAIAAAPAAPVGGKMSAGAVLPSPRMVVGA
jgi:hypothetical protein